VTRPGRHAGRLWPALLLFVAAAHAVHAAGEVELAPLPRSMTFVAGFKPQANLPFVAAYVAQEQGYFAAQGLDVTIHHSTGQHLQLLLSGDVDITTAAAGSVLKRRADPGVPIRAIALFGQRGQQTFIALADSGIDSPRDWEGRTVGYRISLPPEYLAIVDAAGVNRELVQEVRVGFDPRILVQGKVDVLAVFKSNEPYIVRNLPDSSFELNMWDPADLGVPTMGLTYITRQETVDREPDMTERFLKATLKGIEYIVENPEGALDTVMEYAPDEDRDHMRFMLEAELADAVSPLTDRFGVGWMTEGQWKELYDHLVEYGAIEKTFDFRDAFYTGFLEDVYDGNELKWP
jgi:ABC-type nitrate/sulfonate/bicarbonate transport system substrate-binding protein